MGARPCWRITGSCGTHLSLLRRSLQEQISDFADDDVNVELRQYEQLTELPCNPHAVRDWIAVDPIRSAVDCFSIDVPPPLADESG